MSDVKVLSAPQRLRLFEAVLEFMNRCAVPETEIRDSFDEALAALQSSQKGRKSKTRDGLLITAQNLPAQILRVWYRDARYIDHDAKPRALHLTSGRSNLSSVIKQIDASADPPQVIRSMKAVGLIRRTSNNRYVPTSETAIVDKLHPLAVEHVTKLVNRLISTVSRNTDRESGALSLIDRHAYTPDLNSADRVAFAEFTRDRGMAYLESIDDWLEQRRVRRSLGSASIGKGMAAGVYLFAYLGDGNQSSVNRAKRPSPSSHQRHLVAKKTDTSRARKSKPTREARA